MDILVLKEHWLWPFKLNDLQFIDPQLYSHLSPTSTLICGCGECAILWKNSIPATPMSNQKSDRVCGILIPIDNVTPSLHPRCLYMPSLDQPQEILYNKHLSTIMQTISTISTLSPLLVVDDLNCHLGHVGGSRSSAELNNRGVQWTIVLDRHSLYYDIATCNWSLYLLLPDYNTINVITSTDMVSCKVEDEHPLNSSDHLPITSKPYKPYSPLLHTYNFKLCCTELYYCNYRDGCVSK